MKNILSKLNRIVGKGATRVTKNDIRQWNIGLGVAYAVQAVVLLILSVTKQLPVIGNYLTKDEISSSVTGSTVLATATRRLFDVDLAYLLAAALVVAALTHLWWAWKGRAAYERAVSATVNPLRWAMWGLAAVLLVVATALLAGVNSLNILILIIGLTLGSAFFGYVTEEFGAAQKGLVRRPFRSSVVTAAGAWLPIFLSLAGSRLYGADTPLYVCVLFWSTTVLALVLALIIRIVQQKRGQQETTKGIWQNPRAVERTYMLVEFVLIAAVVWQVFVGALRP